MPVILKKNSQRDSTTFLIVCYYLSIEKSHVNATFSNIIFLEFVLTRNISKPEIAAQEITKLHKHFGQTFYKMHMNMDFL